MTMRITEQGYLVLLSLAEQPRHGYGIVGAVLDLSDGATKLGAGTLYGLLDRMVDARLVEACGEEVVDGRLRLILTRSLGDALVTDQFDTNAFDATLAAHGKLCED